MPRSAIICLMFCASGFASLVFEVSWCRLLLRALGAGSSANACVFAAFMAGAAVGAFLCWRHPTILGKLVNLKPSCSATAANYLRSYGRLELITALSGWLICVFLNSQMNELIALSLGGFAANVWLCNLLRFLICFVLLGLPCAAMGASFFALSRAISTEKSVSAATETRNVFPLLYGCNTIGAAIGSLTAAFLFLPSFGIFATSTIAALIDLAIFGLAEYSGNRYPDDVDECVIANDASGTSETSGTFGTSEPASDGMFSIPSSLMLSVFLSGFLALILEIVWTRVFSLVLGSSVYSVAVVLLMVLLGAGLAAMAVQCIRPGAEMARRLLVGAFALSGIFIIFTCYLSHEANSLFVNFTNILAPHMVPARFGLAILARIFIAAVFVLIPSALIGAILPLSSAALPTQCKDSSILLYAINCLGALTACLLFSFLLFPIAQSTQNALLNSILLVAGLALFCASILLIKQAFGQPMLRKFASVTSALCLLLIPSCLLLRYPPDWDARLMSSGFLVYNNDLATKVPSTKSDSEKLLKYVEGINSTISATEYPSSNSICVRSDGKVEATMPIDPTIISPGNDLNTHVTLAALPTILHEKVAESALLIGLGSGVTASTLLSFPELRSLTVAELEPTVAEVCRTLGKYNGAPLSSVNLNSGKLNLRLEDARFALSSSKKKFDLIISQPADPWVCGSADLYTKEFWRLVSSRLMEKGVFCQWVQLYAIPQRDLLSIIVSFDKVFKSTCICHAPGSGEILLLGFNGDGPLTRPHQLVAKMQNRILQSAQTSNSLARAGISNSFDIFSLILCGPKETKSICHSVSNSDSDSKSDSISDLTDDKPFLEYSTCKSILTSNSELDANFHLLSDLFTKHCKNYVPDFQSNADDYAQLGRAQARALNNDPSGFKSLRQRRSFFALDTAISLSFGLYTQWCKAVVLSSLGKNPEDLIESIEIFANETERPKSKNKALKGLKYDKAAIGKLALFDFLFGSAKLDLAKLDLDACDAETQTSAAFNLRKGFLSLRQGFASEASLNFDLALKQNPCLAEALLGSSYAAQSLNDSARALTQSRKYLQINPWNYAAQLNHTLLLCRLNQLSEAYIHARCATQLRPSDPSALVLVLQLALKNHDEELINKIATLLKTTDDPAVAGILKLLNYRTSAPDLAKNAAFEEIVNSKTVSAEDPKTGYKMLGEP